MSEDKRTFDNKIKTLVKNGDYIVRIKYTELNNLLNEQDFRVFSQQFIKNIIENNKSLRKYRKKIKG